MTENSIIFRDNQEVQAADFNNMQQWITDSIDHVVLDENRLGLGFRFRC